MSLFFLLRLREVITFEESVGRLQVKTELATTLAGPLVLLMLELLLSLLLFADDWLDLDIRIQPGNMVFEGVERA